VIRVKSDAMAILPSPLGKDVMDITSRTCILVFWIYCCLLKMTHEDSPHVHLPLLPQDLVGVIESFLDVFVLRRTFIRVCKLWFATGIDIVRGIYNSRYCRNFVVKAQF